MQAVLRSEANNQRFVLAESSKFLTEIGNLLHNNFAEKYPNVVHTQINKTLMWVVSCCDSEAAMMYGMWGKEVECDNSSTKSVLGIEFKTTEQALKDMVPTLEDTGYLKK